MTELKFGGRIKRIREMKKLTQQAFAEKVGVSKATVNSWENSGKFPSVDTAAKIADTFGVSLDWLCGVDKPRKPMTYRDVVLDLISIADLLDMKVSHIPNPHNSNDQIIQLLLEEAPFDWFLGDWIKVRDLYDDCVINEKIYYTWLDGAYSELDKFTYDEKGEAALAEWMNEITAEILEEKAHHEQESERIGRN